MLGPSSLVHQVWTMDQSTYLGFSSKPLYGKIMPSLFGNAILDQCSMTPWYVPGLYLIWVVAAFQSWLPFLLGIASWTLLEYVVHRFIFHIDMTQLAHYPPVRLLHFILHSQHHVYPDDPLRLVLPPAFTLPFAYLLYNVLASSIFSGLVFGYVAYDIGHYWMHHVKDSNVWPFSTKEWKALRSHHMTHHYSNPRTKFGVSSPLWDYLGGSEE